jgi:transposase
MTRRTREQWAKRIEQWQRSGMDAASFAAREGVKPEQLRWWRWRLGLGPGARKAPAQPSFVEVVLPSEAEVQPPAQEGADIELLIGQRRVLVRPGFDAQSLRRVLAVLEEG